MYAYTIIFLLCLNKGMFTISWLLYFVILLLINLCNSTAPRICSVYLAVVQNSDKFMHRIVFLYCITFIQQ